jgi:uncharacterized protein
MSDLVEINVLRRRAPKKPHPFLWQHFVPSKYGARFAYGHVVEDERHLIVSGGLGTSIIPARFGVPPEILHIELGA